MSMALAATIFAGCSSEDDNFISNDNNEQGLTIIAKVPQEKSNAGTRAIYEDTSDGSTYTTKVSWNTGDGARYALIHNSSASKDSKTFTITDGKGVFTLGVRPDDKTYLYVAHPISGINASGVDIASNSSTFTITPKYGNQGYIYSNITEFNERNILVGCQYYQNKASLDDMEITFKNTFALLKFQLQLPKTANSRIEYTKIMGWDGSDTKNVIYGGNVTMTGSTEGIAWSGTTSGYYEATRNFSFTTPDGKDYKTATFYALVTPQTFNGLYLEVKDHASVVYTYKAAGDVELKAGYMYGIKAKMTKVE